jgi:hypothetical protein
VQIFFTPIALKKYFHVKNREQSLFPSLSLALATWLWKQATTPYMSQQYHKSSFPKSINNNNE